jgi:hypothetical protein
MATVTAPPWLVHELAHGEELHWCGISGGRFYRAFPLPSVILSLFGLLFAAFVLTTGILVVATDRPGESTPPLGPGELSPVKSLLVSIAFSLVGFSFVVGPWVMHRVTRWQIGCAVTSKRALLIRSRIGRKAIVESIPSEKINMLVVREYPDGYGNAWISSQAVTKEKLVGSGITWRGLLDVPDVRGLAQALEKLTHITPDIRRAFFARLVRV